MKDVIDSETEINLFDVTESTIQRIMLDLRRIPSGKDFRWDIRNPNADTSRLWAEIVVWANRPMHLRISLVSRRHRYGDWLMGECVQIREFSNLSTAEKYLRRKVHYLQRIWYRNWPEGNRMMRARKREYLWEHS